MCLLGASRPPWSRRERARSLPIAPFAAMRRASLRIEVLPTRNPKVIFKALATGAVLYSTDDEVYFGLNPVGVRVWELLPPVHKTLDEVCRVLAAEYPDAPEDVIRTDVSELLDELIKLGLLVPSQASAQHVS